MHHRAVPPLFACGKTSAEGQKREKVAGEVLSDGQNAKSMAENSSPFCFRYKTSITWAKVHILPDSNKILVFIQAEQIYQ